MDLFKKDPFGQIHCMLGRKEQSKTDEDHDLAKPLCHHWLMKTEVEVTQDKPKAKNHVHNLTINSTRIYAREIDREL